MSVGYRPSEVAPRRRRFPDLGRECPNLTTGNYSAFVCARNSNFGRWSMLYRRFRRWMGSERCISAPERHDDGTDRLLASDPIQPIMRSPGGALPFRAALCWYKGQHTTADAPSL